MFKFPFLVILNLKEKSGRVVLAEFNSFPSQAVNKHTGVEDPSLIWQMRLCRETFKQGNTENWYVQNPF